MFAINETPTKSSYILNIECIIRPSARCYCWVGLQLESAPKYLTNKAAVSVDGDIRVVFFLVA